MAMTGQSRFAGVLLIASGMLLAAGLMAHAIVGMPEPLDAPLAEEWRAPVEQFFSEWGIDNVKEVLASTKAHKVGIYSEAIILRLEHGSFCDQNFCLTIIGEIKRDAREWRASKHKRTPPAERFQARAMFAAGRMMTQGDVFFRNVNGIRMSPPLMFFREKGVDAPDVSVFETDKGWLVAPGLKP